MTHRRRLIPGRRAVGVPTRHTGGSARHALRGQRHRQRMPAGSSVGVFYLGDAVPGATTIRLAVAVIWRHEPYTRQGGARRWERGPVGWLRGLRHRLWL